MLKKYKSNNKINNDVIEQSYREPVAKMCLC